MNTSKNKKPLKSKRNSLLQKNVVAITSKFRV